MHSSVTVDCSPEGARRARSPRAGRGVHTHNGMPAAAAPAEPRSVSELQLYWVLQQANLLSYYHTFISQGGDDVQQLCEAGEVEFLEIMALVGMASKPLHVRRLQKALREWASGPGMYARAAAVSTTSVSRLPGFCGRGPPAAAPAGSPTLPCTLQELKQEQELPGDSTQTAASETESAPCWDVSRLEENQKWDRQTPPMEPTATDRPEVRRLVAGAPSPPPASTPTLSEGQIRRLAAVAAQLARALPRLPPRTHHNGKKKACAQLQAQELMRLPADEPSRLERYRQHAAIYGRFDAKRSAERPLSLHEVFVNEAAAHICLHVPALLSRRDDLFPLARQVVRLAGFQYSKGHSRSQASQSTLAVPPLYGEEAVGGESETAPTSPDRSQRQGSLMPSADGKRLRFSADSCSDGGHGGDTATCSVSGPGK